MPTGKTLNDSDMRKPQNDFVERVSCCERILQADACQVTIISLQNTALHLQCKHKCCTCQNSSNEPNTYSSKAVDSLKQGNRCTSVIASGHKLCKPKCCQSCLSHEVCCAAVSSSNSRYSSRRYLRSRGQRRMPARPLSMHSLLGLLQTVLSKQDCWKMSHR